MIRAFVTSTYRKFVGDSEEQLTAFLFGLMARGDARVWVAERNGEIFGTLGVLAYIHPMSGEFCAGELFWWLHPEHRGYGGWLLRRAESWAKAIGCVSLQMIQPEGSSHVGAMYERLDYAPVERMYQKRFQP